MTDFDGGETNERMSQGRPVAEDSSGDSLLIPGKLVDFHGKVLMIGLGSIGLGVLPLLHRHLNFTRSSPVTILTGSDRLHVR